MVRARFRVNGAGVGFPPPRGDLVTVCDGRWAGPDGGASAEDAAKEPLPMLAIIIPTVGSPMARVPVQPRGTFGTVVGRTTRPTWVQVLPLAGGDGHIRRRGSGIKRRLADTSSGALGATSTSNSGSAINSQGQRSVSAKMQGEAACRAGEPSQHRPGRYPTNSGQGSPVTDPRKRRTAAGSGGGGPGAGRPLGHRLLTPPGPPGVLLGSNHTLGLGNGLSLSYLSCFLGTPKNHLNKPVLVVRTWDISKHYLLPHLVLFPQAEPRRPAGEVDPEMKRGLGAITWHSPRSRGQPASVRKGRRWRRSVPRDEGILDGSDHRRRT